MPDKSIISRVIDWLSVGYPKEFRWQDRAGSDGYFEDASDR